MSKSKTASRLGGQAAFFLLGNIFTLLVGFPLQIYVARKLGTDGLGAFSLIEGGVSLVAGLVAFGLAPTLVKFIPMHLVRGEYGNIRRLIRSGVLILVSAGVGMYGLMYLLFPIITQYWPDLEKHRQAVYVMGLLVPLGLVLFFLQQGLRGFQEVRYMVLGSSFLQLTVKALLALLLLSAGFHLVGYVWAIVISVFCAVGWMSFGMQRSLASMPTSHGYKCDESVEAWRDYAKVMYSGSLLGMAGGYLDRFLLGLFVDSQAVGILFVIKQLQQMPVIFLQMFLSVASPMFSSAHARGDHVELEHIYRLTVDWVVRLSAPLFIFFFIFAEPLLGLYGADFAKYGILPFWVLLAGQVINLGFGPIGNVMYMSGLESKALRISVYQTGLNIIGYIALTPIFGLMGVVLVTASAMLYVNIAEYVALRRESSMRWFDRRYLRWVMPLLVSATVGVVAKEYGPIDVGPVLLVVYLVGLYLIFHGLSFIQGLHDDDKEILRHMVKRVSA